MKLSVMQENLARGLGVVSRAVSNRSTLPVLANVLLKTEDGGLRLTTTNLEIAQASYLLNDYMTIGAGRFLNPMNYFVERQHMGWVNKFPDKPLAVYDGLLPESDLGVQLRGVIPIGPTKLEYAAFVANAPDLITTFDDPTAVGMLDFGNTSNRGGHFTVGGHVGFISGTLDATR